jgi:hypothetical protein
LGSAFCSSLEIYVIGIDLDKLVDDGAGNVIAQPGLVDALVEPDAGPAVIIVVILGFLGRRLRHLDINADIPVVDVGQRHHRLDAVLVIDQHDPHRLQALGAAYRRQQDAQLLAFLEIAVARAVAEHGVDGPDFLGDRAEIAQDGAEDVALLDRDEALVSSVAAGRLGGRLWQLGDVLFGDTGLERRVGVVRHVRHSSQNEPRCGLVGGQVGGFPDLSDDVIHRRRCRGEVKAGEGDRQIAGDERDLGVGRCSVGAFRRHRIAVAVGGRALRVKAWDIGRQVGCCQREIARNTGQRLDPGHFTLAYFRHRGDAKDLAGTVAFSHRREAVALADDRAGSGAHRRFHPFRGGGEVSFAERCENRASHQESAAQARQNRAAEPPHRHAAAIKITVRAPVHKKRQLVAEIDCGRLRSV